MIKRKTKILKNLLVVILLLSALGCNKEEEKFHAHLNGDWQITKLLHGSADYSLTKIYVAQFSSSSKLWIRDMKGVSIYAQYDIAKKLDTWEIDISKCGDANLNGNYTITIDTIQESYDSYLLQLTLDKENIFMQAIRPKLKQ